MSTAKLDNVGQNHDRMKPEDAFVGATVISSKDDVLDSSMMDITAGQKMLSAITGSLLTSFLVTPLDVVRVRLQSQTSPVPGSGAQKITVSSPNAFRPSNLGVTSCCREVFFANSHAAADICIAAPRIEALGGIAGPGECAVEQTERRTFTSTLDGIRKIARNEGIATLWRGLTPTLAMAVPGNIIYFTGYEWLRHNPASPIPRYSGDTYAPLVAGSVARMLAAAVVNPIELFRTRLQASTGDTTTGHVANTFKDLRQTVADHGYRALWRGLTLTAWRDVPFSAFYWWGYEAIRGQLTDLREQQRGRSFERGGSRSVSRSRSQSQENHSATFIDSFTAGALSGMAASIVTMPFDVGKTRTQVFRDSKKAVSSAQALAPEEQSMVRLLWHIYATEGIPGLWKGWIPRTLKVAPACAIMISSYEVGKTVFRGVNERAATRKLERELR